MLTKPLSTADRRLIARLRTPALVQRYLNALPYNTEPHGRATLRSFRGVVAQGNAHCLEAALFAAVVLEHHGYPPRLLSFESVDQLDHVLFVYQHQGRWGSIGRSRDPGLHGRRAVFATPRSLASTYVDPYVDYTGRLTGFAVVDLSAALGGYDWRYSAGNVWKVERVLLDYPHESLTMSDARYRRLLAWYKRYRETHGDRKPVAYRGLDTWSELPPEYRAYAAAARRLRRPTSASRDRNR